MTIMMTEMMYAYARPTGLPKQQRMRKGRENGKWGKGERERAHLSIGHPADYRVTVVVADLGWVDLKWDIPTSCLGSRKLQ